MDERIIMLRCSRCSSYALSIDVRPEWEHSDEGEKHRLVCPKCHKATTWYRDGHQAVRAWIEGAFVREPVKFRSVIPSHNEDPSPAILDSGDRTEFTSGAVRDMHEGKGRCDLLPMCALLRLARHYENGCKKYGDRNWEKGIPGHSFADSAMRHLMKYMDGQDDEDHLIAAVWNLLGLAWTEEKHPELIDIPARAGCASF